MKNFLLFLLFSCLSFATQAQIQYGFTTCPTDLTLGTNSDGVSNYNCSTTVKAGDGVMPGLYDPNGQYGMSHSVTGASTFNGTGTVAGLTFNKGINTVTYSLNNAGSYPDAQENRTCSFTVTIKDTEAPKIKTYSTSNIQDQRCTIDPTLYVAPTVSDNCSAVANIQLVLVSSVNTSVPNCATALSAVKFTKAILQTWRATDEAGNTATATQRISIRDNVSPILTTKVVNKTIASSNISVTSSEFVQTVTDVCTVPTSFAMCNNTTPTCTSFSSSMSLTPSMIPVGQNSVTINVNIRATDGCGNTTIQPATIVLSRQ